MKGLTRSIATTSPLARPTDRAGGNAGDHAGEDAELQHRHSGDAARKRHRRADREIETTADNDEGHAHGDHRHDRRLHEDICQIERREKAAGQERGHHAQDDKRDQRRLARPSSAVARAFSPAFMSRSPRARVPRRGGRCARCATTIRPLRIASTASHKCASSERSLEFEQHAAAARGEITQQRVDLRFGRDVDALRRLVEQQHFDAARQPFGENDLLLIAAGQRRDFQLRPARANVEKVHQFGNEAPRRRGGRRKPSTVQRPRLGSRILSCNATGS